jgi:hypothetical protein
MISGDQKQMAKEQVVKSDWNNDFHRIWIRFNSNIGSLWVYCNEITKFADQWAPVYENSK